MVARCRFRTSKFETFAAQETHWLENYCSIPTFSDAKVCWISAAGTPNPQNSYENIRSALVSCIYFFATYSTKSFIHASPCRDRRWLLTFMLCFICTVLYHHLTCWFAARFFILKKDLDLLSLETIEMHWARVSRRLRTIMEYNSWGKGYSSILYCLPAYTFNGYSFYSSKQEVPVH